MGLSFMLEVIKGNYNDFFHEERNNPETKRTLHQPGIVLRFAMNQMYIEPQDQRSRSSYPKYLEALFGRAALKIGAWGFLRFENFCPNPRLEECFFVQRIVPDALNEISRKNEIEPSWRIQKEIYDKPLSDDFLRKMFEDGLSVRYVDTAFGRANVTPFFENRKEKLLIKIGKKDCPPEERDSVLVHEVVEAYLRTVFRGRCPTEHNFVNALEDQLYEFGFAQTVKRLMEEYDAVRNP